MERHEELGQLHGYGHDFRTKIILNPQECGPLRLNLRKSISLANIIETTLIQENQQKMISREESVSQKSCSQKLKASHIHAISLQIGSWKWESTREGDLVAKIYYAKKKLVWELLFGHLKRKIEISWSEISAINSFISEEDNGHLEIELNEPPQFSQEINSQPRKHTQWTSMNDFTGEQALIYRRHKAEFLPGVLDRHLEKLLQCDNRLLHLSRQPFPINNPPLFPDVYFNFSHNQNVNIGCSSSGPQLPSSARDWMVSRENQIIGDICEQSGRLQIQGTSFIPIEEQDHFQSYHEPESMILDPHMELFLNNDQNLVDICKEHICSETYSNCNPFYHEHQVEENYNQINGMNQFGYVNNMYDTNYGGSHVMDYVGDGIRNVYPSWVNGGVVIQEPHSCLADQVDTNYQEHVLSLDQKWRNMEDGDQNYKP